MSGQARRRESKLGALAAYGGSKIGTLRTSKLAGSKLARSMAKSLVAGDEEDELLDVKYDFGKLATAESPEALLQSMSFHVDTSRLYAIESTCIHNQANPYCPVQIRVNDQRLAKAYGGSYLG